jgi:hypothetical protein
MWLYFYRMNRFLLSMILLGLLVSCSHKKKQQNKEEQFFPVSSYLKGQVAMMDSSLSTILAIQQQDSSRADTTYIRNKEFKKYAKQFLDLPDISSDNLRGDYQVTNMYDDLLNSYIFTYTTNEKDDEIKKQDVLVEPGDNGDNTIKTVNIDRWVTQGDSTIHQNMLWESGKRFLIITKMQKQNQPEKIHTLEVKWNNPNT